MRKFKPAILLLLAFTLILTACGSNDKNTSSAKAPNVIRFADINNNFPFLIAKEKGFFDEEFAKDNITMEVNYFLNGPAVAESFAADHSDFGLIGDQPALQGIASGYGYKIVAKNYDTTKALPIIAGTKAGITKLEDLKGKKVAAYIGTSAHHVLLKYLDSVGLSQDDIELFNLANDVPAALESGDIDAAIVNEPIGAVAVENGSAVYVADGIGFVSTIIARDEFIENNPELTARVLKVLDRTFAWIAENEQEALELVAAKSQIEPHLLEINYRATNLGITLTDENVKNIDEALAFIRDQNIITNTKLTIDDAVDRSYLEQAGLK